jgi:uncharacterized protein (DUF2141 family)
MNVRTKLFSFIVFALIFAQNSHAENAGLKVIITDIDNTKGNVVLAIYNQDDNFPYNPFKKYTIDKESMTDGKLEYLIQDINPGEYAITLLDDKNKNYDMDTNFIGLPKEGFGFSNNVKPSLAGAPPFEKCTFNLKKEPANITIKMQYF